MIVKLPSDPCGRCGCERRFHNPPKSYSYAKTGSSSGKSHMIEIKARTCCDSCPHCFCFCIAWIEPFKGQPFQRCYYETEDHNHYTPPVQNSDTVSRLVSPVQSMIPDNKGNHRTQQKSPSSAPAKKITFKSTKTRKVKQTPKGLF